MESRENLYSKKGEKSRDKKGGILDSVLLLFIE